MIRLTYCDGGLRDVRGEDYLPLAGEGAAEHALLLFRWQHAMQCAYKCVQCRQVSLPEGLADAIDGLHAAKEHQDTLPCSAGLLLIVLVLLPFCLSRTTLQKTYHL